MGMTFVCNMLNAIPSRSPVEGRRKDGPSSLELAQYTLFHFPFGIPIHQIEWDTHVVHAKPLCKVSCYVTLHSNLVYIRGDFGHFNLQHLRLVICHKVKRSNKSNP